MNNITKTYGWLTSQDETSRPIMRDGIWAIMGWKDLQEKPIGAPTAPFMWLMVIMMALMILPVLAWSDTMDVPVLKHSLKVGATIQAEDVGTRTMDAARVTPRMLLSKQDLIGMEVFRSIRAGFPIYDSHIRVAPTVRKNSDVTLIYNIGGIQIQDLGRALGDAPTGQTVRVMNRKSGKILAGTVLKDGRVSVQ